MSVVDIICTSYGKYEEFVKPYAKSVALWEPGVQVVWANAGDWQKTVLKDNPRLVQLHAPGTNCQQGQNRAMHYSRADWFLVTDIDVHCTGKFTGQMQNFKDDTIYGVKFHKNYMGFEEPWIDGWIYAIPRRIYQAIGGFDEEFEGSGFEDLDYCYRAIKAGFQLQKVYRLPFIHLEVGVKREFSPDYDEVRQRNIERAKRKHPEFVYSPGD